MENTMSEQTTQKKSDRTRQRIFEAAMSIMVEKGYQGVTIRDICERAEVSIGSFYRYFETKSDILRGMYETGDQLMQEENSELTNRPWLDRIMVFISKYAQLNMDTGLAEMKVLYNPENTWFTQTRPMQQKLESLISGAQRAGELTVKQSAAELTELLFVCMRGMCYDWCISNGEYNLKERMTYQMSLLMGAFFP